MHGTRVCSTIHDAQALEPAIAVLVPRHESSDSGGNALSTQEDKIKIENTRELLGRLHRDDDDHRVLTDSVEEEDEFVTDFDKQVSEQYDGRSGP